MVKKIPERNQVGKGAPYQRVGLTNTGWWDSTQLDQFAKDTIGMLELAAMYGNAETARKLAEAADEWRAVNQATLPQRWREFWSSRLRRHHYNNQPHPETGRVHRSIFDHKTRTKYFVEGRRGAAWFLGLAAVGAGLLAAPAVAAAAGTAVAFWATAAAGAAVGAFIGRTIRSGRFIPRWPAALNRAMCRYMESVPDPAEPGGEIARALTPALQRRLSEQGKFLGRVTWDWPNQIGSQVVDSEGYQHYFEVPVDQKGSLLESRVNLRPGSNEKQFRLYGSTDDTWYDRNDPQIREFIEHSSYNTYPKFSGAIYQILETDMAKGFATARHMTEIADQADQVERLQTSMATADALVHATGRVFGNYGTGGMPGPIPPPGGGWPPPWMPPPAPRPRPRG